MTLGTFDVTSYNTIDIEFYFYPNSMENGEDFWVQFHDGTSWNTVASYASGTHFNNNSFYTATVTVDGGAYNFPTNAQFRFRCDASTNQDRVYIDQITITANTGFAPIRNSITNLGGIIDEYLGDEDIFYEEKDFVIYPNPAKTVLNVIVPNASSTMTYRIVNISGQLIEAGDLSQKSINVERLPSGIYFMEVNDGDEIAIASFIKE
ncbi:MAG: T9SS type A sorting domain-containing protein [Flavobacteriaceae bacterium]|nr:T9SS type A sorting domain-containing protein [Flavobacteriaceae bacterium]